MSLTKTEWENLAVDLLAIVKRNVTGWERDFSEKEVKELRKAWNENLCEGDDGYWYNY
jgi:hypothetical protein